MSEGVRLHGGPFHGNNISIEEGKNFLLVAKPMLPQLLESEDADKLEEPIALRKGSYSRVGKTHDFEWDGWQP